MARFTLQVVVGLAWIVACWAASCPSVGAAERVVTNSIGMKLALVPPGEFLMGSTDSVEDARHDEKPRHRVQISRPFYIGVYEVTQEQYEKVVGTKPSFFSPTGPGKQKVAGLDAQRFPAEQVTWTGAVEFCRRLSELPAEKWARRSYRLPTEAEWEYAGRAGTETAFCLGDSLASTEANFNGNHPYGEGAKGPFLARTTTVGSYAPNAFGLYDMHGNVWEWCADWYGRDYYEQSPARDPTGPKTGSSHVIRGGAWYSDARDCRSGFRNADIPDGVFYVMGFRVVMTLSGSGQNALTTAAPTTPSPHPTPLQRTARPPAPGNPMPAARGEDWPRWRGPRGDGTWKGPRLPQRWPESGLRCFWRQAIGGGYSGVVVADGRVYTMDLQEQSAQREGVLCFDALSGELLWSHRYRVQYDGVSSGNGPRSTPTVFDCRVYTLGATGHLACLHAASGRLIWRRDLVGELKARVPMWGLSASPVVFEDLLIVHAGVEPDGCLIALDRKTGKEIWRSVPDEAGYATPILIESQGVGQLVCWTPAAVRGLEPRTGSLLWTIPFKVTYGTSIATPIFQENTIFVSGYWEGSKAIRLGNDKGDAQVVWEDRRNLRGLMSQPLYRDGHVFLLDKRHGLTCFELASGKKIWDDANRMTPKGRNPQATMVWMGEADRTIILNSEGELILARLNRKGYHEQSRTKIIGHTWAHPAYAGHCVYARDEQELVCVSLLELATSGEKPLAE